MTRADSGAGCHTYRHSALCAAFNILTSLSLTLSAWRSQRNVNTADSTGKNLQTRVRSYKGNEAFSIRNGEIIAVSAIRFPSLGMLVVLFMVALK